MVGYGEFGLATTIGGASKVCPKETSKVFEPTILVLPIFPRMIFDKLLFNVVQETLFQFNYKIYPLHF